MKEALPVITGPERATPTTATVEALIKALSESPGTYRLDVWTADRVILRVLEGAHSA